MYTIIIGMDAHYERMWMDEIGLTIIQMSEFYQAMEF